MEVKVHCLDVGEITPTISTKQAWEIITRAGHPKNRQTLLNWIVRFNLGFQLPSGQWRVYPDRLVAFLQGGAAGREAA